jgi:putative ABC transport system permease protein
VAEIKGSVEQLQAVNPATAFEVIDVEPRSGDPGNLGPDSIAVFEDVAKDDGLKVGDRVPVLFKDTGNKELTVAMVYGENQPIGDYLISTAAYEANFADQFDAQIFIDKADAVSAPVALAAIERVAGGFPGAEVRDRTGFKADQTSFVNQMLGLVYALLALAIVIALLGIGNTLALSILERTRELGLMRAVGMTRSQLRSTVRWESVVIALQGTLLGLVVGVFFGWALVQALKDEGIDQLQIPFGSLALVVLLGGIAGVLAAILPARRAAKLDILRAIVTE